jgi:3,4-dihydroxy 2-butanone 4-phosphate synthase/GTP cyclohydrolase II
LVIVVDDPGRENEGDLVMAAQFATAEAINFMATQGRGLICVPMASKRLDQLGIEPMRARNGDRHGTAFHVSVDARERTSTGISAADRAQTIRKLADPASVPADFTAPGHVFPLAARSGGLRERQGHTEAAIELTTLASLIPAAVICEIADEDGEMMRTPRLTAFAEQHRLTMISIGELIAYLNGSERLVWRAAEATLPLPQAEFRVIGYGDMVDGREHLALVLGDVSETEGALVRLHSECLTGDVLGSRRCDCGRQLELALASIAEEGRGVLVYLRGHEGRGIGLLQKLSAYRLQDEGLDTVEANLALGHRADARDYWIGAEILTDLGADDIRLLTNNPSKCAALEQSGVRVRSCVPLIVGATAENVKYLATKRAKMGHLINLGEFAR